MINQSNLRKALSTVLDPESGRDLVSLGVLREIHTDQDTIRIELDITSSDESVQSNLRSVISAAVRKLAAELGLRRVPELEIEFLQAGATPNPLPLVRSVIAVGAGKGGVGKSTVAVHLALTLARMGRKVGILDGDIYGPSLPTMLGLQETPPKIDGNTIIPFEKDGLKVVSIGRLVEPEKALVWRGPMAHGAFRQLALQSDWGELDHLIVDLPPALVMSRLRWPSSFLSLERLWSAPPRRSPRTMPVGPFGCSSSWAFQSSAWWRIWRDSPPQTEPRSTFSAEVVRRIWPPA